MVIIAPDSSNTTVELNPKPYILESLLKNLKFSIYEEEITIIKDTHKIVVLTNNYIKDLILVVPQFEMERFFNLIYLLPGSYDISFKELLEIEIPKSCLLYNTKGLIEDIKYGNLYRKYKIFNIK